MRMSYDLFQNTTLDLNTYMKYLLLAPLLLLSIFSFGQKSNEPTPVVEEPPLMGQPKVFTFVEKMPEFPGGEDSMMRFLQKNIMYPQSERDNDIQGRVIVRFVVNEDGSLTDIAITRGVSPGLDKEDLRVVRLLPKFKPGMQQGKPVSVYFNLPIRFKLS
jgi:protein TonB